MKFKFVLISLLFSFAFQSIAKSLDATAKAQTKPKLSIVIDDLGDNSVIARQLLSLSGEFTAAILPHTPHAKPIAEFARANGHEVIMHLPMEATTRPDLLGPGALFADMEKQQLLDTFLDSASSIPNIVGFNNHMGSLLTVDEERMRWVMESAKQNGWYFLDSKTTVSSVAQDVASDIGLPTIGRDVFLDHHSLGQKDNLSELIEQRMTQAMRIAKRRGEVVVICHPYPETLAFLREQMPLFKEKFRFVRLSKLIKDEETQSTMAHQSQAMDTK
ncbi:divergent polysaccharide deacetylase family protein [Aliikangiella marina]|nr:divergent polysaccharide deacetylase family protein [Aliikangiella marina]